MKHVITFLPWASRPSLEIEIPDDTEERFRTRAAVEIAVKRGTDLRGTNLRGTDLRGTDLRDADLRGTNLRGTNLRGTDLRGTNLRGTNLRGTDLRDADLRGTDLRDADLRGTNLRGTDLRGTDLRGTDLRDADLRDANLRGTDLSGFRTDLFDILLRARPEVAGLLKALRDGKINGSTYTGSCACLVGTIANIRGVDVDDEQFNFKDGNRPAEVWFYNIREGDTPETSQIAKITEGWILEFQALISDAPAAE